MPTHWTYAPYSVDDDLMQGDILIPTDEHRLDNDALFAKAIKSAQ